jgi:hypothetical protein
MAGSENATAAEGAKAMLHDRQEQLTTLRGEKKQAVPLETQYEWAQKTEARGNAKLTKSKATAKQLEEQLALLQERVREQHVVVARQSDKLTEATASTIRIRDQLRAAEDREQVKKAKSGGSDNGKDDSDFEDESQEEADAPSNTGETRTSGERSARQDSDGGSGGRRVKRQCGGQTLAISA